MATARRRFLVVSGLVVVLAAAGFWIWAARRSGVGVGLPPGNYAPQDRRDWEVPKAQAKKVRDDALSRARVWRAPARPIPQADLTGNPGDDDAFQATDPLPCKFLPSVGSGTTPKFDCVLRGGEVVKVKYGGTPEIPSELAATRLLAALGFGSDRMYLIPRVRCYGCPALPFHTYKVLDVTRTKGLYEERLDYARYTEFPWVAVERRLPAASISAPGVKGWAFFELARIDPAQGGAPRREVDALRLLAVFLHHWDNKSENQRLVCLDTPQAAENGPCPTPFAFLQDVGAVFGPNKVALEKWRARPVWRDAAACTVDMDELPYGGGTFARVPISEEGRRFLAERLQQLSETQLRALFVAARFPGAGPGGKSDSGVGVVPWVRAFQDKVREIADRAPCPP